MTEIGGCSTLPAHDCFAWQRQHYCNHPDYQYSKCGMCGTITGFRWRKLWPRFRSLFTSEPLRTTIEAAENPLPMRGTGESATKKSVYLDLDKYQ